MDSSSFGRFWKTLVAMAFAPGKLGPKVIQGEGDFTHPIDFFVQALGIFSGILIAKMTFTGLDIGTQGLDLWQVGLIFGGLLCSVAVSVHTVMYLFGARHKFRVAINTSCYLYAFACLAASVLLYMEWLVLPGIPSAVVIPHFPVPEHSPQGLEIAVIPNSIYATWLAISNVRLQRSVYGFGILKTVLLLVFLQGPLFVLLALIVIFFPLLIPGQI